MAHKDDLDTSFISNPDVAHEESDIRIRPVVMFLVWLSVATAVVMLLMWGMFKYLDAEAKKQDERERSPLAAQRDPIPPAPRLQLGPAKPPKSDNYYKVDPSNDSPLSEVNTVREKEKLTLENYTWADQSKGIVSLPIDRAKELILERGLLKSRPPQPATAAPSANENAQPAASEGAKPVASEGAKPATGEKKPAGQPAAKAAGAQAGEKKQPK